MSSSTAVIPPKKASALKKIKSPVDRACLLSFASEPVAGPVSDDGKEGEGPPLRPASPEQAEDASTSRPAAAAAESHQHILSRMSTQRSMGRKIVKEVDDILEEVVFADLNTVKNAIEALEIQGDIIKCDVDDGDKEYYTARSGLSWSNVVHIDCPIKKQILLTLIDNPQTFFVFYNTQKGKLAIAITEIKSWALPTQEKKVVTFLVVDNDKTLADQTAEGVMDILNEIGEVSLLSSSTGEKVNNICNKIDSYATYGGKMPIIVLLNNPTQRKKMLTILKHIKSRRTHPTNPCKSLFYGVIFDEADKVYPACRETFLDVLVTDNSALHRLGFVTATEGDLLSIEDYPESANAYKYDVPDTDPNYRAIHTVDAKINYVPHKSSEDNSTYATNIITTNKDYFYTRVQLKNGTLGFRKTIVIVNPRTASMDEFAIERVKEGAVAITINMHGIWVHRPDYPKKRYTTKGKRFSKILFEIYTELGLASRPLFIIGNQKIDRGLGFHWAPKDGTDGLIWTDEIMGRIKDKYRGSQKAGRLAGKVAQCPQYPMELTWWTDRETADNIVRHNKIVDNTALHRGCSALQAFTRAEAYVPEVDQHPEYDITDLYHTYGELSEYMKPKIPVGKITRYTLKTPENTIQYRANTIPLHAYTTKDDFKKKEIYWGINKNLTTDNIVCRIMPVMHDGEINYIGIYLKSSIV